MESFWPIILVIVVSIISSILKKAKSAALENKKVTHFDSKGRPLPNKPAGISDLLKEFQKLKEAAEQKNQQPLRQETTEYKEESYSDSYPEPAMYNNEEVLENQPMSGSVSMQDRIAVREKALEEFVDEDHPIFKGAGKAAESRVDKSATQQNKIFQNMFSKENLVRSIILNETVFSRKS